MSKDPNSSESAEVAVVGGGVIGMTIALRLARDGRQVLLIEPNGLGSGASFGNAGTIADYATLPVANPGVLRDLPGLLSGGDSPFALRRSSLVALMPWLMRFGYNCLPHRARQNAVKLSVLLADAPALWRELAADIGAEAHMHNNGVLYRFDTAKDLRRAEYDLRMRRDFKVNVEVLTPDEAQQLEPKLPPIEGGAHYFPDAVNIDDPGAVMAKLAAALQSPGVRVLEAAATGLTRRRTGVEVNCGATVVTARRVVIAAGAHSRPLAAMAGDHVPLDTERGYHLEYDMDDIPIRRVVCPAAKGFYMIPMRGRLRIAGTVELGGLGKPANPARHALLERGARSLLPDLGRPDRVWDGYRPSVPDSIPVIRPSRRGDDVIYAFGHGHLGLTMAPITARRVAQLITESAGRF